MRSLPERREPRNVPAETPTNRVAGTVDNRRPPPPSIRLGAVSDATGRPFAGRYVYIGTYVPGMAPIPENVRDTYELDRLDSRAFYWVKSTRAAHEWLFGNGGIDHGR